MFATYKFLKNDPSDEFHAALANIPALIPNLEVFNSNIRTHFTSKRFNYMALLWYCIRGVTRRFFHSIFKIIFSDEINE